MHHHGPVLEVVGYQGQQGGPHPALDEGLHPQLVVHPVVGGVPVDEERDHGLAVVVVDGLQDVVKT